VSDDVSLAQPPRRVSQDESSGAFWEIYLAVCLTGVLVLVLLPAGDVPLERRLACGALLLAMAIWYVLVGRPTLAQPSVVRGLIFQAGILALFVPALALVTGTSFLLFGLCPLAYMTLRTNIAHGAVVVLGMAPTVVFYVITGDRQLALKTLLPISVLVIAFSIIISIAMDRIERRSAERAALIEELASTRAEVERLAREAGIAHERQRLAGEIHDTVAQGLSSVVMLVQAADAALEPDPAAARQHLALAARTARENLAETRAIVAALTPTPLAGASLAEALSRLGQRFQDETGVPVTVAVAGGGRPLPTAVEVVLLRAAQEALTNARRHAAAQGASVTLTFDPDQIILEVRDDGAGFDPCAASPGYGLPTMRGRIEQVGGELTIHSAPSQGTTIRAEVPA